ncbi:bifunctional 2-C-methyl-D-erythritol 4-phosphate cytidylyltransferase/2-C-methyl-D-erythritol 2,4-cyclodiphosphate synthase [Terasakiella sp. A23]|uniref:bifunctional 2-C-methyl-D-erythritol 4-phosphate cytidylyltransferase/2-C-methyl-D-erythritol 2,4-cyclodiphosphate synthase n=1 Tax=Terasakiella sp. FCG-A23 TaxID=3080561 RepID=UPI0029541283|nr:bifunctional 2-C-methyl-D-erythritol 4-phosphate cytidylyltransferase/2-C-methyl-D-erythritol 2,4-cyclodiphosphate synthase [Terasakiella sp. A23]MDV7338609.1 bifunctional 2-C-methyl-D-erythritol 4-phosphate cytidylyltransferase/2-C-methyl-D-erythritol 2,4-cyclodiphosphate synthase [Terasakiella sp. A23]
MKSIYAIIVAAGRGRRFGGDLPKQYCQLGNHSVLRHTVQTFLSHPKIRDVRVLIHPDDQDLYESAVAGLTLLAPAFGGATRQDSVCNGLESLADFAPGLVLIHDAARPFVSAEVIDRVIEATDDGVGVIPALPVADTIKREENGLCGETVDRSNLWRAQTPQGFMFSDIYPAHQQLKGKELTDDAALLEAVGKSVRFVMGNADNFKITTQEDLFQGQRIVETMTEFRTGSGFDVHRFCEGDHVTLCGVKVPHNEGLKGHSDADVALHALTDAIMGAIGAGDIGSHFPPSDAQWKGASSDRFLNKACDLVAEKGGILVNVDLTIICERPKIGPHRDAMRQKIAEIAGIEVDRVSVKGTTTEKLGFTGRGEGIAAQAVVSVKL